MVGRLEGTWVGRGLGVYPPRVSPFEYTEILTVKPTAKPHVWEFRSATKSAQLGKAMHVESGFIRAPPNGDIELVASHPFGLVEISSGACQSEHRVELKATEKSLTRTGSGTAPHTTGLRRVYELSEDGESLRFIMDMSTSDHAELQNHLLCELRRHTL